mgnify:CR=1 FL=1
MSNKGQSGKRASFSGKIGYVLAVAGSDSRPGKYLEIPVSGGKIRRRYFFTDLHYSGTDIWLFNDRGGDSAWTNDEEKSGRCFCQIRQI